MKIPSPHKVCKVEEKQMSHKIRGGLYKAVSRRLHELSGTS